MKKDAGRWMLLTREGGRTARAYERYAWVEIVPFTVFFVAALGLAIFAVYVVSNPTAITPLPLATDIQCIPFSATGDARAQSDIDVAKQKCAATNRLATMAIVDATRGYVICEKPGASAGQIK